MPHLMRQGEHIIQFIVIIHQYIGIGIIGPPGIGAAGFAFVFINVNPAAVKTLLQTGNVFSTQGLQRLRDRCPGLGIRNLHFICGNQGGIKIIKVHFIQAQQFFANGHIAVHKLKMTVNRFNQTIINLNRHIVLIQGRLKR
ncbi:hypothetical protein SDC9_127080 [bioreactor metagenome]|uniref:Uncharacterized protein n=1 Tax=bioreactor metagenome TaxID=1076179 RepID=A0A645CSE9_9ZZZZ